MFLSYLISVLILCNVINFKIWSIVDVRLPAKICFSTSPLTPTKYFSFIWRQSWTILRCSYFTTFYYYLLLVSFIPILQLLAIRKTKRNDTCVSTIMWVVRRIKQLNFIISIPNEVVLISESIKNIKTKNYKEI